MVWNIFPYWAQVAVSGFSTTIVVGVNFDMSTINNDLDIETVLSDVDLEFPSVDVISIDQSEDIDVIKLGGQEDVKLCK